MLRQYPSSMSFECWIWLLLVSHNSNLQRHSWPLVCTLGFPRLKLGVTQKKLHANLLLSALRHMLDGHDRVTACGHLAKLPRYAMCSGLRCFL